MQLFVKRTPLVKRGTIAHKLSKSKRTKKRPNPTMDTNDDDIYLNANQVMYVSQRI